MLGRPRGRPRRVDRDWRHARHLAYTRYRCQCRFRSETYISEADWNEIWNTEDLWREKGRHNHGLVLAAIDFERGHDRNNVALVRRINLLRLRRNFQAGLGYSHIPDHFIERRLDETSSTT